MIGPLTVSTYLYFLAIHDVIYLDLGIDTANANIRRSCIWVLCPSATATRRILLKVVCINIEDFQIHFSGMLQLTSSSRMIARTEQGFESPVSEDSLQITTYKTVVSLRARIHSVLLLITCVFFAHCRKHRIAI